MNLAYRFWSGTTIAAFHFYVPTANMSQRAMAICSFQQRIHRPANLYLLPLRSIPGVPCIVGENITCSFYCQIETIHYWNVWNFAFSTLDRKVNEGQIILQVSRNTSQIELSQREVLRMQSVVPFLIKYTDYIGQIILSATNKAHGNKSVFPPIVTAICSHQYLLSLFHVYSTNPRKKEKTLSKSHISSIW